MASPAAVSGSPTAVDAAPRAALEHRLQRLWYAPHGFADALAGAVLWPAAALVGAVSASRRRRIAQGKARPRPPGRPKVVVIGNLVAGGAGKTPLIVALAQGLRDRGWRPGVLARGYRSAAESDPGSARRVPGDGAPADYGDEPVLVARRTGVPVVVGRDRERALQGLLAGSDCDVVLSDDGLQHVGLRRDLELAVFDARGAGNGRCLPAGPLREPLTGALLMDALVLNGPATQAPVVHSRVFRFEVVPTEVVALDGTRRWSPAGFADLVRGTTLDAVAGIGAPQRFFDTLAALGISARPRPLPDHSPIDPAWLASLPGPWLIMTEKDAVKCTGYDAVLLERCVALRVEAVPDAALLDWLEDRLRG
jgi:tetraacyldisaccharide 4'-kinase